MRDQIIQRKAQAKVDLENNLLLVKGAVPGAIGSVVLVKSAAKTQIVKAGKK